VSGTNAGTYTNSVSGSNTNSDYNNVVTVPGLLTILPSLSSEVIPSPIISSAPVNTNETKVPVIEASQIAIIPTSVFTSDLSSKVNAGVTSSPTSAAQLSQVGVISATANIAMQNVRELGFVSAAYFGDGVGATSSANTTLSKINASAVVNTIGGLAIESFADLVRDSVAGDELVRNNIQLEKLR